MKIFLDTNVLIYWLDAGPRADQVENLLAQDAVISVQVLNEFANVLRKKRQMPLPDISELVDTLLQTCDVCDLTVRIHRAALELAARYQLSIYDANIIAAAGESGCALLYSEDMQHGMSIRLPKSLGDGALSVRNPFI
ncbi:MAG: PIN domain-containing protein [Pseudomonadota bacterium]